jgi:carboxypeptidase D
MVPYDKPLETLDMINRFIGVEMDGGNSRVGGSSSGQHNETSRQEQDGSGGQHNETNLQEQDGNDGQHDGTDQPEQNGSDDGSTSDEEGFGGYGQSAGSYGALILLVSLILIGACWYWPRRNKEPASSKFRLGDQDETTEL